MPRIEKHPSFTQFYIVFGKSGQRIGSISKTKGGWYLNLLSRPLDHYTYLSSAKEWALKEAEAY